MKARDGLLVLAVGAACAAVVWVSDSLGAALLTALLLAAAGVPALTLARWAARRERPGGLRRRFALVGAVAVGQLLLVAALFVAFMFVSLHDAVLLVLVAVFCAVVAIVSVRPVALDALERLAEQEQARRSLVAAVSHDLRTPITSLKLLVQALDDEIIPAHERRATLARMGVHLDALGALIDDLFELSRLEAGQLTWSLQRVRLDEVVGETVEAMQAEARARGVGVRAAVPAGLAPARANPEKLQRVLLNLIQNAIRHTPADGSVTVLARAAPGGLEVEVADTGSGIPAAERERVFEAFHQAEASRSAGGAGLGLAIARAIVEAHGGRIWLADAERGTSVRFSLRADGA